MESPDVVAEKLEGNHIDEKENVDQASDTNEGPIISSDSVLNKSFPLKYPWGFFFLSNDKNLDWMKRLSRICTLNTVEEFWAFVDRIRQPSIMPQCDYSLFKYEIEPVWEVPENVNGGRLVFQLQKPEPHIFDELWLKLMLGMIGDYFGEETKSLCGAVCSSRQKGSKISLWTTNAEDDDTNKEIGNKLKALWGPFNKDGPEAIRIHYEVHRECQSKTTSSGIMKRFTI